MFTCNALDKNNVPRVWGQDKTPQKAETQCRWALKEYLLRRRDMHYEDFRFVTTNA